MASTADRSSARPAQAAATVREAVLDLLRRRDLTTVFSNPGSTEIPFLAGFPHDLRFVLGLHEGSVIGMASGYAMARRAPAFALLHTTAGYGNAINALSTARANRTPLVVAVGQQDRRHIAYEPFLAGRLDGLAGDYPVWFNQPLRPQDVPAALERAYHEAETRRGPAVVVVPMGDWEERPDEPREPAAPARVLRPAAVDEESVVELAALLESAESPALVSDVGNDTPEGWQALVALAERLAAPVFHEAFSGGAGFPRTHPLFRGVLPNARSQLRETLAPHDVVLVVGGPAFRQYNFQPGPFVVEGTRVGVVTEDPDEAHRSSAELVVLGSPALVCAALAERLPQRDGPPEPLERPAAPAPPAAGELLSGSHVLAALTERLPAYAVVIEEAPSHRPELEQRLRVDRPLGLVSAAMGGLGYGLNAAVGLRMGLPERPVVAVLGDGATLFGIHGVWSAAEYRAGALFVVLKNGGYRVMDMLARMARTEAAWPAFEAIDVAQIARGFGCDARTIRTHDELVGSLDEVLPTLAQRAEPLLLEIEVAP